MAVQFLITTTGTLSPVSFPDIGSRDYVHPTTDLDMIGEEGYQLEELRDSQDIADAIDAGHITVEDANGNPITDSADLESIPQPHILTAHTDVVIGTLNDRDVLSYDAGSETWTPSPRGVPVSPNDQASATLTEKLVAGANISLTEQNDGGVETLLIDVTGAAASDFSDVLDYGHSSSAKNKFLKWSGTHHKSSDSTALALYAGEVVHVAISTEKDPGNNWFLQIVKNATKDGAGVLQGGTQIGSDLEKTAGALDKTHRSLAGYTFAQDDRISCRVKEGTLGGKDAQAPVVRLFVRYAMP